jgi:uncharacterized membrane protein YraQ (UPF0718 family)
VEPTQGLCPFLPFPGRRLRVLASRLGAREGDPQWVRQVRGGDDPGAPLVFILIGLVDVWVPRKRVEEMLGDESGLRGMLLVILLAFFNAGPLYAAFPIAIILRRKGCSLRNIFVFLGAFAAMKIPMISFEIGFMGLEFSLLRLAFTLPLFTAMGILMEKILGRGYEMRLPG